MVTELNFLKSRYNSAFIVIFNSLRILSNNQFWPVYSSDTAINAEVASTLLTTFSSRQHSVGGRSRRLQEGGANFFKSNLLRLKIYGFQGKDRRWGNREEVICG